MSFVPRTNFDGVLILDSFESDNNSHGVLYVFAPTCLDAAPEVKWESKDKTHKQVVDIYNKTGGAIFLMAKHYGLPLETVLAVFAVEAGNCGSHVDGRVTIRVEARPPVLSAVRWCKDIAIRKSREKEFRTKYGAGQPGEWNALKVWWAKSGVRALNYTSFGLSQVLGSNYSLLGYK